MVVVPSTHLPVRGAALVKSAREQLDIVNAYAELGSYRAAAELCGTTHKTVRRIIERHRQGTLGSGHGRPRGRTTPIG
jgi:Homeodomain-like domain